VAPSANECVDFIISETIRLKLAPGAQSAGIAKSEISSFADAAFRIIFCVSAVQFVENFARGDAIRFIARIMSGIEPAVAVELPLLAGDPRQNPAFNAAEIRPN
jgi:hypothetical protein